MRAGGLWWDEDEEFELASLLSSDAHTSSAPAPAPLSTSNAHNVIPNVNADGKEKKRGLLPRLMTSSKPPPTGPVPPAPTQVEWVPLHSPSARAHTQADLNGEGERERRGSATSDDSRDSELDAAYAVRPRESLSFAGGFVPGYSVEKHLRRPARGIEAFSVSPLDVSGEVEASEQDVGSAEYKRERRLRKRPAPLTLPLPLPNPPASHPTSTSVSSHPSTARTQGITAPQLAPIEFANPMQPTRAEREGRHEYFASSFSPAPSDSLPTSTPGSARVQSQSQDLSQNSKASRRGSITSGFSALGSALSATSKSARRASVANFSSTSPSPFAHAHANVLNGMSESSVHLPANGHESVGAIGGSGITSVKWKTLRSRASRSKLASLFKR
ncbi:hypothetical protein EW145_g7960 [Phellinidium pouzarii]|uniref:Uncharacterized protein n=1 Tax=Phellinidium pouzarii TaxID=167371 RepID=A0A4S4KBR2_9AGAM|nr:hypothetical protein EW145_g7960 [Phellinidium pouzarii]